MLGFFLTSRKLQKSARGVMAGTPDIMIAQKPVRLPSPASQGPPASAAAWELLGSMCPNTLQMPRKNPENPGDTQLVDTT